MYRKKNQIKLLLFRYALNVREEGVENILKYEWTIQKTINWMCRGKTILARQLEYQYSALRLTPDEWHTRLFGHDVEEKGKRQTQHTCF
jgi:hypothetical protein